MAHHSFRSILLKPLGALAMAIFVSGSATTILAGHPVRSQSAGEAEFYAAPDGRPTNQGTAESPWDLQTAFNQAEAIAPGSVLWLRGGTYRGRFTSRLLGAPGAPVLVASYPGEWATLDGYKTATLAAAVDGATRVLTFTDAAGLENGSIVRVDDEHIQLNGRVGNTFRSVNRGWNGTRAVPHAAGAAAKLVVSAVIELRGTYTWLWDLEVTNSDPERISLNEDRGAGVNATTPGHKLINLVVHDNGHPGIGFWGGVGDGGEVYGCLVWGNGTYDRNGTWLRGAGIYTQNDEGTRYLWDNIWFRNLTEGVKVYGTAARANGFDVRGNLSFDHPGMFNIWVGTEQRPVERLTLVENYTYHRRDDPGWDTRVGYQAVQHEDATIRDNYIVAGRNPALTTGLFRRLTVAGNTLVSGERVNLVQLLPEYEYDINDNRYFSPYPVPFSVERVSNFTLDRWRALYGFDLDSTLTPAWPAETVVFVRPNLYEPGRAHVAVYNWEQRAAVAVDLAGTGLQEGDAFEVRDAQNFFGPPLVMGVYDGLPVTIPMNLTEVTPLVGRVTHFANRHTAPEFGVFVVMRR